MNKITDELMNELKNSENIETYLKDNENCIENKELYKFLNELLKEQNISKAEAVKKSNLDQIYAYQIFSGLKKPSRDKIISLSFGMGLSLEKTQKLLRTAQLSILYPKNKRDSIIIFAINKKMSVLKCEELLYNENVETLQKIKE